MKRYNDKNDKKNANPPHRCFEHVKKKSFLSFYRFIVETILPILESRLVYFLLLTGCATSPPLWKYDAIETQTAAFDCSRLSYLNPKSASPLRFEMTRIGYEIGAYLNLTQYRLTAGKTIALKMIDGEEIFEEELPLLQGRMRLRLSPLMTQKISLALQEGRSVKLSVDGFEEVLKSENFAPLFHKLVKNSEFLQNILQEEENHEPT